jgi:TolB-like protein/DNA-binding winged helix-turn-helix (wHTH) protein
MVGNDFRIGSWLVQPSLNTISRNGKSIHAEPKVMEVLVCLAEYAGQAVPKEKLIQTVWPDTFVTDDVLIRSISELRRVFEDDAKEPRVIQTIAKRGYRLVAPVEPVNGAPAASTDRPSLTADKTRHRKMWIGALTFLGMAVLLFGLVAGFNIGGLRDRLWGKAAAPRIQSLAVLPLANLSGDPSQEYFADGMTDALITDLAQISSLKVISRTSTMRYKKSDKTLPEIAQELNVDGIVEGTVQRSGDRVRITAQLIHAPIDKHVWASSFERDARDVLTVEGEVAQAIAVEIRASLTPQEQARLTQPRLVNLKAHEAYLRGWHEDDIGGILANRQGMQKAAGEHLRRAVEYYEQAIREDPGFAPAYLALANNGWPDNRAEIAARKALEIDDSLSDAHLILGAIKLVRDLDWRDAERELLRAIGLNPNNAAAHQGYAYFLDAAGRLEEGMREYERAQELDPGNDHLASALYSRRQFDRLIELERDSIASDPASKSDAAAVSHKSLMVAYARTGKYKESIEEFRSALVCMGFDNLAEDLHRGYARGGYQGALREWLKGVQKQPDFSFHWVAAYVHSELGDRDAALAWLPRMKDETNWFGGDARVEPNLVTLRIEPMWDPLRSDPRFEDLVRSVKFPH